MAYYCSVGKKYGICTAEMADLVEIKDVKQHDLVMRRRGSLTNAYSAVIMLH